jgi:hypothetical protein
MEKKTKFMFLGVAIIGVIAAAIWFGPSLVAMIRGSDEPVAKPGPTPAEQRAKASEAKVAAAEKAASEARARAAAAEKAKEEAEAAAQAAQATTPAPITPVVASGCNFSGWSEYCDGMAKTQQVAGLYPFVVVRSQNPFSGSVRVVALCHGGKNVELPARNFTASRSGRIVVRNFKYPDKDKTVVANYTVPSYGWGDQAHLAFQTISDGTYVQANLVFVNTDGKCEEVPTGDLKLAIARVPENGGAPSNGTARVSAPARVASPAPAPSDSRLAAVEEQVAKNTGDILRLDGRVTSLQGEFHAWASRDTCGPDCDIRRHMQRNVGHDGFLTD